MNPVIFIPTNFFQNDEIVENDIRGGRFPIPMKRLNRVDVRDLAELCARALLNPAYPPGEHMVAGPESLSGHDCSRIWSEALEQPVTYVGDDPAVWRPIFRSRLHGKKHEDFEATAEFLGRRSIKVPKAVAGTTRLLGRAPRSYRDYVAERAVLTRTAARRKF